MESPLMVSHNNSLVTAPHFPFLKEKKRERWESRDIGELFPRGTRSRAGHPAVDIDLGFTTVGQTIETKESLS